MLFDQTTGTLLCGDLFIQVGAETVPVNESEILTASEAMRKPGRNDHSHPLRRDAEPVCQFLPDQIVRIE